MQFFICVSGWKSFIMILSIIKYSRMCNRNNKRRFRFFPLLIITGIFLLGLVVMLLWNAILPVVLHAGPLNYWQAVGLLILCRILFGGLGRRFGGPMRGGMSGKEKWMNMSDEEKEKFRERWNLRGKKDE